jgi:hypothetical protein
MILDLDLALSRSVYSIHSYISDIVPSSIGSLSSSSISTSSSFRPRSITADSVVYGELLLLDFTSFLSSFCLSLSQPFPGPIQHSNMAERVRQRVVFNPVGWTCGQVRNHSGPGYKYSRFLSMAAVCSSRYGCTLETAVIDRKQSNLGGCPGFPRPR